MTNISHVKKYEQVIPYVLYIEDIFMRFILVFLMFICTFTNIFAEDNLNQGKLIDLQKDIEKHELPIEISEKFYKKEAILKFNDAVKKWELKDINGAINLWKEAVKTDSTLWVAYLGLGQAYDSQKEYKKSLEAYSEYLKLAPKAAPDRQSVSENVKYLTHLLRYGEEAIKGEDYLTFVKTKHQGKEHYVRWDLNSPLKVYFYPADGVPNYRSEFQKAFLDGAMLWQEVLENLKLEVIDNLILADLEPKEKDKKEKEYIDQAQIKVIFPSRFKVKGDPSNSIALQIDSQSFPIIRDKKNFRVLGVIMISPFIYYQSQVAIPLEPLAKLSSEDQIKKLKIIAAREMGHVLGLWGFSPNPEDLMFEGEVTELKLSSRDKNTIKKLYELDPEKADLITNK